MWEIDSHSGCMEIDGGDDVAIKPLREQTLMNNYVFAMVMREPKWIKPLLEYILGKKIKKIRMVEPEKTMKEKFESKGIQNRCDENHEILFGDDATKVVVNTKGTKGDISPELKEAIIYLDREEVTGSYSKELDDAVNELKSNEERGQEYMMLMSYGAEQKAAGKYIGFVEQIRRWYEKKSSMPVKDAADYAGITPSQFEGVLSLIKEHPDWDDETVADKANWR